MVQSFKALKRINGGRREIHPPFITSLLQFEHFISVSSAMGLGFTASATQILRPPDSDLIILLALLFPACPYQVVEHLSLFNNHVNQFLI